ncbi:MAG: hypothetical protein Q4A97_03115 [Comamonadaceae bacterium]|nr:hypothetical protein [Comamonadaceae bacterium]
MIIGHAATLSGKVCAHRTVPTALRCAQTLPEVLAVSSWATSHWRNLESIDS